MNKFQTKYKDKNISKDHIFWYVYGILNAPEYKQRFAADLKKMLPRIPMAKDFLAFAKAGQKLGKLHLNYETAKPYPVTEDKQAIMLDDTDWQVEKMRFGSSKVRGKDKSIIHYNTKLTLRDIPLEAYDYIVNGRSAIEWIMERYAVTVDKDSGIRNDPNDWCREHNDPKYIVKLLKRVVHVSIETIDILKSLPPINEKQG